MTLADQFREEGLEKGLERGLERGLEKGRRDAIIDNLETRFQHVPKGLIEAVNEISDIEKLRNLQRVSITCHSIEEFTNSL